MRYWTKGTGLLILAILVFLGAWNAPRAAEVRLGGADYPKAFSTSYELAKKGKYAQALKPLMKIYQVDQKDYFVVLRIGYLYYLNRDYTSSTVFYKRAARLGPNAVEPLLGLMLPLAASRNNQAAAEAGLAALRLDPHNYTALSKTAWSFYQLGRFREAESYYRRLVEDYPMDLTMRNGLAWSYLKQGLKDKAKAEFSLVLAVSPDNQSALAGYKAAS